MTSLARALTVGAAIALLAIPAIAQEEEAPAAPERAKPVRVREPAAPDQELARPARAESTPAAKEETSEAAGDTAGPSEGTGGTRRARRTRVAPARPAPLPRRAPAARAEPAQQPTMAEPAPGTAPAPAPQAAEPPAAAPAPAPQAAEPPAAAPTEAVAPAPPAHQEHVAPAGHPAEPARRAEHPVGPAAEHPAGHEAGHGEHASFSVGTFILQLFNFGVLLFLLIYFGGRAMNKALRARHEQLKSDIEGAARIRDEAKRKYDAQERRVAELEKEIAALRASMRKDGEQEQARMVEAAQERAKRLQEEMRVQVEEQVKVAEAALRAEVATASVKLAVELLRKAVTSDDERRLAREFVAGFAAPAGSEGEVR